MAIIKPFRAIRPTRECAKKIAALPYDVYSLSEAKRIVEHNPMSFLAVDRVETGLAEEKIFGGKQRYERAGSLIRKWQHEGYLVQDESPCLYLYELTFRGRVQNGIVAVSSVDDYVNSVILKHEKTRKEKEQDRIYHIEGCDAQTGPVFMVYDDRRRIHQLIEQIKEGKPEYDFCCEDGVRHRVFLIKKEEWIREIVSEFHQVDRIYIADGHHRCAAAVKVCLKRRTLETVYDKNAEYNFVLSVLFPQSEVEIWDYNRVVRDLNGLTKEEFLEKLQKDFKIEKREKSYAPCRKRKFGMYLEKQWYALEFRGIGGEKNESPTDVLDASILQEYCLKPILGIIDPRTDPRIDFVGGIRGMEELERRVREDCKVAFSVKAVSMEEVMQTAKEGSLMPPKSTWFEPKVRSGLFLHDIGGRETS